MIRFDDSYINKEVTFIANYYQNGNGLTCKAGTKGIIIDINSSYEALVKVENRKRTVKLYNHCIDGKFVSMEKQRAKK